LAGLRASYATSWPGDSGALAFEDFAMKTVVTLACALALLAPAGGAWAIGKTAKGAIAGAAAGAVVAGPVGAVVGAGGGAVIGHHWRTRHHYRHHYHHAS
jgi:hypothetical protein